MKNVKFLLVVLVSLVIMACGGRKKGDLNGKKVFRYNESAGISFLDPAYSTAFEDCWAMNQLFNGLVQLDNELRVIPCIASSWEISDDKTEYTFHLRNDVFFHDHPQFEAGKGRKVVAQDFVNSFFRITDPETASPGIYVFKNIDKSERSNNMGFVAVNDSTLKIYLTQPQHSFLEQLTLPVCSVVPLEIVDYYGKDFTRNPVGTGPFQFKTWHDKVKLVMVKNENYFERDEQGNRLPYIDAVSVSFIREKDVEYKQFLKGQFEFISGLHPSYQENLLTSNGELRESFKDKMYLQRHPWLKTDYIGILVDPNKKIVKESPLRNKLIRQAINYAIDRKAMVNQLRNGIGMPAEFGFCPVGLNSFKYSRVDGFTYDMDKARALLFEAETDLKNAPEVVLITTNEYKHIAEYIQSQLTELGLKIKMEVVMKNVQTQMIASSQTNLFRKSWTADYPDAINFLQLFYSGNKNPKGPNYTQFYNIYYDQYFEAALKETDELKRFELYRQMEEILLEEAPVIPLFYDEVIHFVQNNVEGLELNAMNMLNLKRVRIK